MSTPGGYTPFFNLILPTVGGNAVDWATWTNQNWQTVDEALQTLTDGKLSLNPVDGTLYGRMDGEWVQIDVDGGTVTVGIGEAPNDGNPYLRQSQAWVGATPIIEGIAETAVADALEPLLRSRLTTSIAAFGSATPISQSVGHSDLRDKTVRVRIEGYFNLAAAYLATAHVFRFVLYRVESTSAPFAADASVSLEPDSYPVDIPFVFEAVISDFAGANQTYTTELRVGDPQGNFTRVDSTSPGYIAGGLAFYEGTADLTGAGTKTIEVLVESVAANASSTVEIRKVSVSKENT